MYVPRQTLSIEIKEQFWNKVFYFLSFSICKIFWCWWLVWLYPHTLYVPSATHPYTSNIYSGVSLPPHHLPRPRTPTHTAHQHTHTHTHTTNFPGMMIQTYLNEFTWQGKLFQMIDSPQSDPLLPVHYLIGLRLFWNDLRRGFSFFFLCYQIMTISNIAHWWH